MLDVHFPSDTWVELLTDRLIVRFPYERGFVVGGYGPSVAKALERYLEDR